MYARFADDMVVLVDGHPRQEKLLGQVYKRLIEELMKLEVEVNKGLGREESKSESLPSTLGHINLDTKRLGKRSAGKQHAAFEMAGLETGR
ncbi:MAG: hypothetical protein U9N81_08035 [Bacillota bacterium]|nr:hypothetical protein [Bacillota bacterium]